jgi:murein DD-endopeptidase MepM/ murein hydrolase activator NlpD
MVKATHLEKYGNQFKVYYEDGSTSLAYHTQGSIWLVSGESGGGSGGTGDYSWPYALDYVTSEFGPRGTGFHEGMDWSGGPAVLGEPIPAIGNGTVDTILSGGGFGNGVILFHGTFSGYDWYSLYAHMNTAPIVSVSDVVSKGDTLGPVGNTGASYGAHLHMETHRTSVGGSLVWANTNPSWSAGRTAINPRTFMAAYGDGAVIIP